MNLSKFLHFVVYVLVGCGSITLAFLITTELLSPAHSQNSPSPAVQAGSPPPPSENSMLPPPEAMNPAISGNNDPAQQMPNQIKPQPGQPESVPTNIQNQTPTSASPAASTPSRNGNLIEEMPIPVQTTQESNNVMGNKNETYLEDYMDDSNLELGAIRREGYVYNGLGRRDPFIPYQSQTGVGGEKKGDEDLQRYDINQLKVVGIVWDIKRPKAMILDPKGKINIVQKGTKIGVHSGYIAMIREGEIVIIEPFSEGSAESYNTRILSLAE